MQYKEHGISNQAAQVLYINKFKKYDSSQLRVYYEGLSNESKKREVVSTLLILASAGCMDPEDSLIALANLADDKIPSSQEYLQLSETAAAVLSEIIMERVLVPGSTVH